MWDTWDTLLPLDTWDTGEDTLVPPETLPEKTADNKEGEVGVGRHGHSPCILTSEVCVEVVVALEVCISKAVL
jgi:hypothetical protein